MAKEAIDAGAAGVTFGRNVFQDPRPDAVVRGLAKVIYEGRSIEEALRVYNEEGNS